MEKAIQDLLDIHAIEQLMIRYAERIDAKDPEGAAACYTEDGVGNYWGVCTGREEIAARLTKILNRFASTSHHLSNSCIKLDGDQATAMSYVYAFHTLVGSRDTMHFWGRWVDRLKRTDEGWLFADREVVTVGTQEENNAQRDRAEPPGHPGRLK